MSVTWMDDWQRDPCRYIKRKLQELDRLDADRIALGRLQKAFGATTRSAMTSPESPSVFTSAPNPTDGDRRA